MNIIFKIYSGIFGTSTALEIEEENMYNAYVSESDIICLTFFDTAKELLSRGIPSLLSQRYVHSLGYNVPIMPLRIVVLGSFYSFLIKTNANLRMNLVFLN